MMKMVFFVMAVLLSTAGVRAEPDKATALREQLEKARKKILTSEEEQRAVMSSLFEINKKVKHLVSERSKSDQARMTLETSAQGLAEKILELEKRIKDQKSLLQLRLNAIYRLGGQGLARLVFTSSSSAELERNLKILGLVAKNDLQLMKDHSKSVGDFSQKREKFLGRLKALKEAQRKVRRQERLIAAESKAKAQILEKIRKNKSKAIEQLQKLRVKGDGLEVAEKDELLDLLLRPSFFEKKGLLPSPVTAPVVRKFGLWKDPEFNVTMNHKGLLYHPPRGQTVSAVFAGRVQYLGSIEGFGSTVILDHGDHYYSVYSGLAKVQTSTGSEVSMGQKIAESDEALYFEIRHFSEPYDPLQWVKGRQL